MFNEIDDVSYLSLNIVLYTRKDERNRIDILNDFIL